MSSPSPATQCAEMDSSHAHAVRVVAFPRKPRKVPLGDATAKEPRPARLTASSQVSARPSMGAMRADEARTGSWSPHEVAILRRAERFRVARVDE